MYLAYLVRSLTFRQRCHLIEVIKRINQINSRRLINSEHLNHIAQTDIPASYPDLRRYVLEGKYAIFENLPQPKIYFENHHSYIKVSDAARDAFGHGLQFPDIHEYLPICDMDILKNNQLTYCSRVNKMHRNLLSDIEETMKSIDDIPLHVFIILWSDSFEPNSSIKANRNSVHITTCTYTIQR